MHVVSHGIDVVNCARMQEIVDRHGQRFLRRVFTEVELEYCLHRRRKVEHLAGRFAAKEAVLKVLGTGWRQGIGWRDVEIRNTQSGQPCVQLRGACKRIAEEKGLRTVLVSISHVESHAVASAIATAE